MVILVDGSKWFPDIPATVINLRERFRTVNLVWGRPDWITQRLERYKTDIRLLEELSIQLQNLLLVHINPESPDGGSIQFSEAEVFVTGPIVSVSNVYELHNTLSEALVYGCSGK